MKYLKIHEIFRTWIIVDHPVRNNRDIDLLPADRLIELNGELPDGFGHFGDL